jgi:glycosyltransferase involved in cell wall biosynthesis
MCGGYDELPVLNALRWAGKRRVPAFLWTDSNVHGDMSTGWRRRVKNLYVPRVCGRYTGILVCGTAGRRFFHRYGVSDDKLHVMPVEPDYGAIEGMSDAEADRRAAELGLEPARKRLVCCCRLIPLKRVDLVIDAFAAVADERPEWDLIIVGKGESQPELERRAGGLLAARRVRFLGFQDTAGVAAIYRRSHAMVLASDYEPWALVVNEAAAAGMAIVASDRVGAAYELVKNGENGFVFPAGDLARLTQCVREVADPARIEGMRSASLREIARWRREADPVAGLRGALRAAGVLERQMAADGGGATVAT